MEATALRGNGDVPEAILEIEGKVVYAAEMCEKHVPILAALQFGRDVLAKQIENGFDLTAFTDSAKRYARAVAEHPLPEAVRHFYRKSGLTGDLAERTYQTVRNILALFAGLGPSTSMTVPWGCPIGSTSSDGTVSSCRPASMQTSATSWATSPAMPRPKVARHPHPC